jgi:DNA-binding Lrp family transcriptional regulator
MLENKEKISLVSAVVLVNTDIGQENKVLESIKNLQEVEEAHALWGVYDLMVKVRSDSTDQLKETIKSGLQQLAGVSSTLALTIVETPP